VSTQCQTKKNKKNNPCHTHLCELYNTPSGHKQTKKQLFRSLNNYESDL